MLRLLFALGALVVFAGCAPSPEVMALTSQCQTGSTYACDVLMQQRFAEQRSWQAAADNLQATQAQNTALMAAAMQGSQWDARPPRQGVTCYPNYGMVSCY